MANQKKNLYSTGALVFQSWEAPTILDYPTNIATYAEQEEKEPYEHHFHATLSSCSMSWTSSMSSRSCMYWMSTRNISGPTIS
jgi:hypothetical protein